MHGRRAIRLLAPALLAGVLVSGAILADDPDAPVSFWFLQDFPAHRTELQASHRDEVGEIARDVVRSFDGRRPLRCLRVIGHAATWKGITEAEYCRRSLARARAAASQLAASLESRGFLPTLLLEDELDLGDTASCTAVSEDQGCGAIPGVQVALVVGGRSDDEPLKDNLTHRTDKAARSNRSINRRVEVSGIGSPAKRRKKDTCKPITDEEIREITFALIGKRPKKYDPAKALSKFVRDGINAKSCPPVLRKAAPEAWVFCVFIERYLTVIVEEFENDGESQKGALIGAAYAILDGPEHDDRSKQRLRGLKSEFRKGFRAGYKDMRRQLVQLTKDPKKKKALEKALARLRCRSRGGPVVRVIYKALLDEFMSQAKAHGQFVYFEASGNCFFDYPKARIISCGPLKD